MALLSMFEGFNPYIVVWLIMIIVFTCVELSTVTLTSIWFAAGALAALLVAMFNGGIGVQLVVFLIISLGCLFLTRPWAKAFLNAKKISTNADRAIGEEVRVEERVSNLDRTGRAMVLGQEWTVRTEDDNTIIEKGELVRVVRISGVKLIVERIKED